MFPNKINIQPAPAVEGDFASANPRWNVLAGPGQLVAGPNGLVVGRFAWVDSTMTYASNSGSGPVAGFVHREMQALITTYLTEYGMTIPSGFPVTLHNGGDFWAVNRGTTTANPGMKVYANYANGAASFAPTGNAPAGASVTGSIAASTFSVTGSISGNVMTVSAVGSGPVVVGGAITGAGMTAGTQITGLGTGTSGVGTYIVNNSQTFASGAISGTYGAMTVTAVGSGALAVGDPLAGANVTAGSVITSLGTGTGGLGTYNVSLTQTAASATITAAAAVETKWGAMSFGAPGELVKITTYFLG